METEEPKRKRSISLRATALQMMAMMERNRRVNRNHRR